jgi:homoserine dehydrogenase
MKNFLLASVASVIVSAFMSDAALEVVTVVGEDGKALRINKTDYDADQADDGEHKYSLHDDETQQANSAGAVIQLPPGVSQPAAPAAPNFAGAPETNTNIIDANKNAVAPAAPSIGQKLVNKEGKKFFIVVAAEGGEFPKLTNAMLSEGKPNNTVTIEEDGYKTDKDAWDAIMSLPT